MRRKQRLRSKQGEVRGGRTRRWREKQISERWGGRGIKVSRDRVAEGVVVEVNGGVVYMKRGVARSTAIVANSGEPRKNSCDRSIIISVMREVCQLLWTVQQCGKGKVLAEEAFSWEEERVRIGTGYRVKQVPGQREGLLQLDLGYGHRKSHDRLEGMGVEVFKAGRKIRWEGKGARQKVMQEVCALERRRPRSVYTGCGRTRKSRVGKKKLKPTKVRT